MGDGFQLHAGHSTERVVDASKSRRLSPDELRWVLERAAALASDAADRPFSEEDAIDLGHELGIDERSIRAAIRELRARPPGGTRRAGVILVHAVSPLPARIAAGRLDAALRRRLMDRCELHGSGCWTQRRDWWPDLQRLGSELHLHREVLPVDGSTHIQMRVDLRYKAVGYGAWAGGGSAAVWLVLGPAGLVPAAVSWAAISAVALSAYRRRAEAIQIRLEELLDAAL